MAIQIQIVTGKTAREIDPEGLPWTEDAVVAFAYDGNELVGRSAIIYVPHIEGTWVKESHRNGLVMALLHGKLERVLQKAGKTQFLSFVKETEPQHENYAQRMGYVRKPLAVYAKEL